MCEKTADMENCRDLKNRLVDAARQAGAVKTGFARCREVDAGAIALHDRWIEEGKNGTMDYLARNRYIRNNPALLLERPETARTVMVMAFPYYSGEQQSEDSPKIARYARGDDYHTVLRNRLQAVTELLPDARICIDSAPVRERWWAVQAGVGFIGLNSQLIVPGAGSYCFLAEIITSAEIEPDEPCRLDCGRCGRCVASCPGKALAGDGSCDARKCLSYLTIEYRGEVTDTGNHLYGCDVCQEVCPHNSRPAVSSINEFRLRPALRDITTEEILSMTQGQFSETFRNSAIKRTKLAGLQRNARAISGQ